MNVDYDAAEYLVNVIAKSPDFCVTYDDLKVLVQQSNQVITTFFDIETKYDFILNKFPEIFSFKNNMISLTDTYLSMYRLEKPSKSLSSYGLAPDMENCAILYFLKILSLHGPQQYLSLFNMLKNDRTQACAYYFKNYADLDVFIFFTSNSEYFILNNDIVRAKASILHVLYSKDNHAKQKLNEFVCFLLKSFGSFHYFELSKCICYGDNCCKTFLRQFSLLKQREHFENLPDAAMDKYGFLSLKNKGIHIELQKMQEKLLLSVCILAFKKKMHFKDLINEVIEKSKSSNKNQLMFFKKFPYYFIVSEDGFVKLLPTFSLPKCSFEDLTSEAFKQVTSELKDTKVKESLISYQDDIRIRSDEDPKKKKVEMGISSVHPELNRIQNNSNETLICYQNITSDKMPKNRKKTFKNAFDRYVWFVLRCLKSMHYFVLRKCLSFTEVKFNLFLSELSEAEQREYFETIPNTVMDQYGFLHLIKSVKAPFLKDHNERKMIILLTVCILTFKMKVYVTDLVNEAVELSNLRCNFFHSGILLDSRKQFKFFYDNPSIFVVSDDGFVQLLPTFMNFVPLVHPGLNKIHNNSPNETVNFQDGYTSSEEPKKKKIKVKKNITAVHPELNKIQNNSNETLICYQNITSDKMPKKRKNAFDYHVWFVLKCRESNAVPMHYFELRKCISYAEIKFNLFLRELSEAEHREYFETIPNTVMDQYGFIRLKKESVKMPILNDRKEYEMMIVLTVCILAFRLKMHFTYLVYEAVEKSNLKCNFFQSIERQFQFFNDNCSVFVVSHDGFVQLSPTFMDFVPLVRPEMDKIQNNSSNETISFQDNITSNEEPKKRKRKRKRKEKVEMDISSVPPELSKIQSNSPDGTFSSNQNNIASDEEHKRTKRAVESAHRVCFVLKCFELMHYFELRECISFAEDGIKNFLNRFSELEQKNYFENIPNTFMDQNGFLSLKNKNCRARFSRRSKIKLLTVCILAFGKKMHFKDLVNEAVAKSNICCEFLKSTEDQRKFFEKYNSIFVISKDGFVKLLPTFMLRRYSFEELSIAFWKTKQNDAVCF